MLVIFLLVYAPIEGLIEQRKRVAGNTDKLAGYRSQALWAWLPLLPVILLIPLAGLSPALLGFRLISIAHFSLHPAAAIVGIVLFCLHLGYTIYSIIALKSSAAVQEQATRGMTEAYTAFLPVTAAERKAWVPVALSAGIVEETVYRGFLFFALAVYLPALHPLAILGMSSAVFGLGHVYQGRDVFKPLLLGTLFGFYYLSTGSLFPVILLHCVQDLVVVFLFDGE